MKIHNLSSVEKIWCGQTISAGGTYDLNPGEGPAWAHNSDFVIALSGDEAEVLNSDDSLIGDIVAQLDALLGAPQRFITDSDGALLARPRAFANADGFHFRGKGTSGTAAAGTTTNIDLKLTEERYINGIQLILTGHADGDRGNLEIVDVDNLWGLGAGAVLDRFAESWFFCAENSCQGVMLLDYPARIVAGLYIRVAYTSTGQSNVGVKANLFLHKKV